MKNNRTNNIVQTSETFLLSALIAFSGGLQDAYTYNFRDHVFANAQTGNVVLMSQCLMTGDWIKGLRYILPLIAFALGVIIAEQIGHIHKYNQKIHWRQIILIIEVIILLVVGLIPTQFNIVANMLVSCSCAMQVQAFRKVNGYAYASTMCIGNLRSGTESLSRFIRDKNADNLHRTLHYYGIILIFALGAGFGGVITNQVGMKTIWISCGILICACLMMISEYKHR